MLKNTKKISNPLTVIAIFAGIAEISGTGILPFIAVENQSTYIWFLMFFPTLLVALFFLTLNFNHKKLYAPSDFREDSSFLAASNILDSELQLSPEAIDGINFSLNESTVQGNDND